MFLALFGAAGDLREIPDVAADPNGGVLADRTCRWQPTRLTENSTINVQIAASRLNLQLASRRLSSTIAIPALGPPCCTTTILPHD